MLGAHVIGFCEKESINNLSRVAPLADMMDVNDFKFSQSPYAIDSVGSSVSSRVQRSSPKRHSPERAEAAPTPIQKDLVRPNMPDLLLSLGRRHRVKAPQLVLL